MSQRPSVKAFVGGLLSPSGEALVCTIPPRLVGKGLVASQAKQSCNNQVPWRRGPFLGLNMGAQSAGLPAKCESALLKLPSWVLGSIRFSRNPLSKIWPECRKGTRLRSPSELVAEMGLE